MADVLHDGGLRDETVVMCIVSNLQFSAGLALAREGDIDSHCNNRWGSLRQYSDPLIFCR